MKKPPAKRSLPAHVHADALCRRVSACSKDKFCGSADRGHALTPILETRSTCTPAAPCPINDDRAHRCSGYVRACAAHWLVYFTPIYHSLSCILALWTELKMAAMYAGMASIHKQYTGHRYHNPPRMYTDTEHTNNKYLCLSGRAVESVVFHELPMACGWQQSSRSGARGCKCIDAPQEDAIHTHFRCPPARALWRAMRECWQPRNNYPGC